MPDHSTVRVFVGTDPNHCDAESQAVLEWSIRKHASIDVEITFMMLSNDPESPFYGWDTKTWATTFSGFRWAVPELCNFEGRAIYCDSDFIFMADIRELWEQVMSPGAVAIGKGGVHWRLCCCLFDCARARGHIPSLDKLRADSGSHGRMNQHFRAHKLVQGFGGGGDWNCLDGKREKGMALKALHYTCMNTQPQLPYALPRLEAAGLKHWFDGNTQPHPLEWVRNLFSDLLREATEHGHGIEKYMQEPPFGKIDKRSFKGRTKV